jgi:peptidoglycan-associated lipoprotein
MLRALSYVSIVSIAAACLLATAGCGGKQVTSSAQDQSLRTQSGSVPAGTAPASRAADGSSIIGGSSGTRSGMETRITESAVTLAQPAPASTFPVATLSASAPAASMASDDVKDLYFDVDRASIQGDAKATLDEDARILSSRHPRTIVVEGHCDERGTSAYNLVLGERRARSVKRYLEDLGATYDITVMSYGKEKPVCKEQNEACWQKNRRAHVAER